MSHTIFGHAIRQAMADALPQQVLDRVIPGSTLFRSLIGLKAVAIQDEVAGAPFSPSNCCHINADPIIAADRGTHACLVMALAAVALRFLHQAHIDQKDTWETTQ